MMINLPVLVQRVEQSNLLVERADYAQTMMKLYPDQPPTRTRTR